MIPLRLYLYAAAVLAILALLAALGFSYVKLADERTAHANTRTECKAAQTKAANDLTAATNRARATEQELQASIDATRKAKDEQLQALARQRDDLSRRLREQSARAAATVPSAPADSGAPAIVRRDYRAELSGQAGQEDIDEAYRADVIRVELESCEADYERARQALKAPPN